MTKPNDAIQVELPVREVTLMEDRARITRRGKAALPAGVSSLTIPGLALVVADKTLQGRVRNGEASVLSAKIHREHRFHTEVRDDDFLKLPRQLLELHREDGRLQQLAEQYQSDIYVLQQVEQRALQEMLIDASWNHADRAAWERDLGGLRERQQSLIDQRRQKQEERRRLQQQIDELNQRIAVADLTTEEYCCRIETMIEAKTAGEVELEFEYVVPAACWRPCHTVTLTRGPDGDQVRIEAEACVWQCTGEDWTDVQLLFSTQRPSLGVEPPDLDQDLLSVRKKPEKIVVETREQTIQTAGLGQAQVAVEMPGIDDGGEVLNLRAAALASVPSDGYPYRVVMFTVTAPAAVDLVCMPELVEGAILQSQQPNRGKFPLLAGPVDLIRDSGKVGRTELAFVAANETFKLGWGPDPEIRVNRWHADEESKAKMLSSWEEEKKKVRIRLSNIGAERKQIKLSERVPISEIEQVEINYHAEEATDKQQPDENGIVTWAVRLEPYARTACDFAYTVRKKKSVEGI